MFNEFWRWILGGVRDYLVGRLEVFGEVFGGLSGYFEAFLRVNETIDKRCK